jgi:dienelactone hydrolase
MRIGVILAVGALPFSASFGWAAHAREEPKTDTLKGELKDEQGRFVIRYAAVVPRDVPPKKPLGMVVGMHGLNGDELQQIGAIAEGLAAAGVAREYVILGLKARESGWKDEDHERIDHAIAWALKQYPVDPRRVFTWGYSSGAFGTGQFVPRHPGRVAGGVMWAGGLGGPPRAADGGEPEARLYLVHGDKDTTVPVETGRKACEQLRAGRYRFVYREIAGADHGLGGPALAPCREDAARWLHALRNRAIPLVAEEKAFVDDVTAKVKEGKTSLPASAFARLGELAGPEVEAAVVASLQSARTDVRRAAAALCQERAYGRPVLESLAAMLDDKEAPVRAAATRALGVAAHWQAPEAVEALARAATDPARPAADRFNAAAQLGLTVPIQLFCVNREARVFDTLQALLGDKSDQVRMVARMGLDGKLAAEGQGVRIRP